jgi:hypothetical protein
VLATAVPDQDQRPGTGAPRQASRAPRGCPR